MARNKKTKGKETAEENKEKKKGKLRGDPGIFLDE